MSNCVGCGKSILSPPIDAALARMGYRLGPAVEWCLDCMEQWIGMPKSDLPNATVGVGGAWPKEGK